MENQVLILSATKNDSSKLEKKSFQFGSCSSRSEKFISASKSAKAFEESLRKYDALNQMKCQISSSPLQKKIVFRVNDENINNSNGDIHIVDLKKKIKKVQSPFQSYQNPSPCKVDPISIPQTTVLINQFDSITQKVEQSNESSAQIEKIKSIQEIQKQDYEWVSFNQITLKIKQVINISDEEGFIENPIQKQEMEEENIYFSNKKMDQQNEEIIKEEQVECQFEINQQQPNINDFDNQVNLNQISIEVDLSSNNPKDSHINSSSPSSSHYLSHSHESELSKAYRQRKKLKKRLIRKQKKKIAKQINHKLQNIESYVENLRDKLCQTDRKYVVDELKQHLNEKKFAKLRNELKKLI